MPIYCGIAEDYASLRAGEWDFYYGYEVTVGDADDGTEEWCFQAKRAGTVVLTLASSKLCAEAPDVRDRFDVTGSLLAGIGLVFERALK